MRRTRRKRRNRSLSKRPLAVAITGGVGAGKSEALKAFARHGAATISSDEVVHELYDDEDVRAALRERYGDGIFDGDQIVRAALGAIVFADRGELVWLEQLLHPKVMARTDAWHEELARLPDPPALAVNEVPLLYEAGAEDRFDAVVVITAPADLRAERAGDRLDDREQRLLSDDVKAGRADFAYVNDGTLDELDAFVGQVVQALISAS
ncbi:MAG: dephospho-CoA kinase [Gaiellaceae bacterium]